jgi:hypothetical protein
MTLHLLSMAPLVDLFMEILLLYVKLVFPPFFAPRPVVSKMREMADRTIFKILVKSHRLGSVMVASCP